MTDDVFLDRVWLQRFATNERLPTRSQRYTNNTSNPSRWIYDAAMTGGINQIRRRLAEGANAMEPDAQGRTPFQNARSRLTAEMSFYLFCVHDETVRTLTKFLGREPRQIEIYGVVTHQKASKFRFHVNLRAMAACTQFMEAVETGDLKTVRSMVEKDEIGVNAVKKHSGETALSAALASNQPQVAMYLLEKGVDPEEPTFKAAVRCGDVELVRLVVFRWRQVLQYGRVRDLYIPALEIVQLRSLEMIETVVELEVYFALSFAHLPSKYPHVQTLFGRVMGLSPRETSLWRLLFAACWLQDKDVFEDLRRAYTELQDLHARPINAAVLLALAVYHGDDELVSEMFDGAASIDLGDAMIAAVTVNSTRSLQRLLNYGGDPSTIYSNIAPNITTTSLLGAAARADAMDCVRMLLPLETRLLYRDDALKHAVSQGNVEIVHLLIEEHAASARERGFHFCVLETKCPVMADLLLTRCWCGGDFPMNALNERLKCRGISSSDPELLAVFVAHGFDLTYSSHGDQTDGASTTPLLMQTAYAFPALAVVGFLLENGVPVVSVKRGQTPHQFVDVRVAYSSRRSKWKRLFGRCRDLLASYEP